jgi:hypothetical protein
MTHPEHTEPGLPLSLPALAALCAAAVLTFAAASAYAIASVALAIEWWLR